MILLIIWISFIITIGISKCNSLEFVYLSLIMLYVTYMYNKKFQIEFTLKQAIILSLAPTLLIWYVFYKCNDFLMIHSYNWETFTGIFLIHSYIIIRILSEY